MRAHKPRRQTTRILQFSGVVATLAAAMLIFVVGRLGDVAASPRVAWPLIAIAFAIAEIFTVHIEFRSEAHTFSLNELPLVVGLVFCDPGGVVLARMVGGFIGIAVVRRQAVEKVAFNLSLFALEAATAVSLYAWGSALAGSSDAARWAMTFAVTLATNFVSALAIGSVIALAGGGRAAMALKRTLFAAAITGGATTSLAIVTVELMRTNVASVGLAGIVAAVLFVAYRGYAALHQRYANLQRLYEFTGALARSSEVESAVRSSLTRARELMRASAAEIYLFEEPGIGIRVASDEDGTLKTAAMEAPAEDDWVWTKVAGEGKPVLLSQATRDPDARRYLVKQGYKDLMMAPLVHGGSVIGALAVHDRMGVVSSFDQEDQKVFETLVNHACVSIQNSKLIDRLREEVAAKQHQALHDMLTGLGNRRMFGEHTDAALAPVDRREGKVAVLLLDLNRFKDVNDSLGHHCGDELLRQVGRRLAAAVPAPATVCRLGGDEFAVLLPHFQDASEVIEAASAIRQSLEEPFMVQDLALGIGAAIGIALSPDHGRDAATLLRHADVAMYQAKESHSLEVYDPNRDQASARRLALAVELREAINDDLLQVWFQPKSSFADGEPVGAEALCRWERPGRGFVTPDEFIPLAESVGLMPSLTMLVLRRAIQQACAWRDAGHPIGVAVNLSARSTMDLSLPEVIAKLLGEYGLEANSLTLEITEGQVVSDPGRTISVLERLNVIGVNVSIDDFGTGYSSLSYLPRLPVHEIKIDKSFVLNMSTHEGDASIVRSVIDLARNLGLRVVAEGVENHATWNELRAMGCEIGQGYFLSRPLPPEQFAAWLRAKHSVSARTVHIVSASDAVTA